MGEFSLKFRGVRGSYPIANRDFLKYGGNTSCIEVRAGGHLIILDAGTGMSIFIRTIFKGLHFSDLCI